jgi:hypothetical protein
MLRVKKIDIKQIKSYSYFFKPKVLVVFYCNDIFVFKGETASQLFIELLNHKTL